MRWARMLLFALACTASVVTKASGRELPSVPCDAPLPAAITPPPGDGTPSFFSWNQEELVGWKAPACTGWNAKAAPSHLVVTVGTFSSSRDVRSMLDKFGEISSLSNIRYWSNGLDKWVNLFKNPRTRTASPNFYQTEIGVESELDFVAYDERLRNDVAYRFKIKRVRPNGLTVEMTNVSPLSRSLWLGSLTAVRAGDLKTLFFLESRAQRSWNFYSVTSVSTVPVIGAIVPCESYVFRALALFRYIADIKSDLEQDRPPKLNTETVCAGQ